MGIFGSKIITHPPSQELEKCEITLKQPWTLLNGEEISLGDLKTNLEADKINVRKKRFSEYEISFSDDTTASEFNEMFTLLSSYGIETITLKAVSDSRLKAKIDIPPHVDFLDSKAHNWQTYQDESVVFREGSLVERNCVWIMVTEYKIRMHGIEYVSEKSFLKHALFSDNSRYIIISKVKKLKGVASIASNIQKRFQATEISIFLE